MSAGRHDISLRTLVRDLLRRREDPYAADDIVLARRIAGLVAFLTAVLALAFLPLAPPTEAFGGAGWAAAAAIELGFLSGAWRLLDLSQRVSWDELYGVSYVGIAAILGMTWLAGGGLTPYAALYPVVVAGAALNPPRRSLPFIAVAAGASWVFGGPLEIIVPATLGWATVGVLITIAADGIRHHSLGLVALARADALTGLGNRRAFEETLAAELGRVRRAPAPLSVGLFDLDGLKAINDDLGHLEGDSCLRDVATALQLSIRGSDRAYRWAGDEFAVLFPDTTAGEAAVICERIRKRTTGARTSAGDALAVSYGVAQLEDGDPTALIDAADRALLAYKAARPTPRGRDAQGR